MITLMEEEEEEEEELFGGGAHPRSVTIAIIIKGLVYTER